MLLVNNDANTTSIPTLASLPPMTSREEINIPIAPHDCAPPRRKKTPKKARDSVWGLKRKKPTEIIYPDQQYPSNCTQLSLESDATTVLSPVLLPPKSALASALDLTVQSTTKPDAELIPSSISSQNTDALVPKKKKKKKTKPLETRVQDNYATLHTLEENSLKCAFEPISLHAHRPHDHQHVSQSHKKHKSTLNDQGIHSLAPPHKKAKTTAAVLNDSGHLPSAVIHFKKQQLLDKNLSLK